MIKQKIEKTVDGLSHNGEYSVCALSFLNSRCLCGFFAGEFSDQKSAANALFPVYDLNCTFSAAAILRLCSNGVIDLDDTVSDLNPGVFPKWTDRITIGQLLSHRSGIGDFCNSKGYLEDMAEHPLTPWKYERLLGEALNPGPLFEPGKSFCFSRTGYLIAAECCEKALKLRFETILENEVLRPCELEHTFLCNAGSSLPEIAPGYSDFFSVNQGEMLDARLYTHPGWYGKMLIVSSANDLCNFLSSLFDCRLFSARYLGYMKKTVELGGFGEEDFRPAYGLGLMSDLAFSCGAVFGHNGSGPGYSVSAFTYESGTDNITVAVLSGCDAPESVESLAHELGLLIIENRSGGKKR